MSEKVTICPPGFALGYTAIDSGTAWRELEEDCREVILSERAIMMLEKSRRGGRKQRDMRK